MNSQYQIRSFEGFEGSHVFLILFINVALTWIGYRKPPKLDYCFIMSTNLVPVAVSISIAGLRNEVEAASKTASTLPEHAHIINHTFECTSVHAQTLTWAWQRSFEGRI